MKEPGFPSKISVPRFLLKIKWLPAFLCEEGLEAFCRHGLNFADLADFSSVELGVGPEVADALGDFWQIALPIVFILDGDISDEAVFANFIEDGRNIDDAGAEGLVAARFRDGCPVLEVEGMHARRDFTNDLQGIEFRAGPVTDVRADSDVRVASLNGFPEGVWIPKRGRLGVIVKTDFDRVFSSKFFEEINRIK